MGIETGISWADHTFSFWWGCSKVNDGCRFCYAETLDRRWQGGRHWGPGGPRRVAAESAWKTVLGWNRAALKAGVMRRTFPSMCDPFEAYEGPMVNAGGEVLPVTMEDVRRRGFELVDATPGLFWMLLTKRPGNVCGMVPSRWLEDPPANVMIVASSSDQATTGEMLEGLLEWPGYKGLSLEPLLGPIYSFESLCGIDEIDWIVVGGESGAWARRCYEHWIGLIVSMCEMRKLPCYVKQMGSNAWVHEEPKPSQCGCREWDCPHQSRIGPLKRIVTKHDKGGDPEEWPARLRVREFAGFMVDGEGVEGRKSGGMLF